MHLKSVCWLHFGKSVNDILINLKYPIYDVYIYHSVYRSTNVPNNTEFKILV